MISYKMNHQPSKAIILEALYNKNTSDIFKRISASESNSQVLIAQLGLTRKQYYSRMQKLISAYLVRRYKGRYLSSTFGRIMYKAQRNFEGDIDAALRNLQKLEAIDLLGAPSKEQLHEIVTELIHDKEIKDILIKEEERMLVQSTIFNSQRVPDIKQ